MTRVSTKIIRSRFQVLSRDKQVSFISKYLQNESKKEERKKKKVKRDWNHRIRGVSIYAPRFHFQRIKKEELNATKHSRFTARWQPCCERWQPRCVFVQGFDISRLGLAHGRANRLTSAAIPQACSKRWQTIHRASSSRWNSFGFNENENRCAILGDAVIQPRNINVQQLYHNCWLAFAVNSTYEGISRDD